jgi:superfamily II DNA or RNA helicase
MTTPLRPFQQALERDIYAAWNTPGVVNVMPVAATGSGKTVVLSKLLYDEPGASAAIAHRQELVSQISIALARNGVRHRIAGAKKGSNLVRVISALQVAELGYSFLDPNAKTGVGGVDTIIRMDPNDSWMKQVRLQVQDEAHHVLKENKWGKVAAMFPNARGLFPTATPARADGKGLGRHHDGIVDQMVLAPSMRDIINMGYLTDYRIFAPPSDLDLGEVAIGDSGEYVNSQLRTAVRKSHITGDVVDHYLKIAPGKLGVTFAVDVETAGDISAAFRAHGVPSEVVSAKTPDGLRADILRRYKRREILQLVNVDLFGEGFDLPAIEVVSFARPTASFPLYVQQKGRTLRLMLTAEELRDYDRLTDDQRRGVIARSGKPYGIVIDHVNNVVRHGLADAGRVWTLDRRERGAAGKKSDAIPLAPCLNPVCMFPYERVLPKCPYCHTPRPPPKARNGPEFVDGDLTELDPDVLRQMRGEISRVDGEFYAPKGLDQMAAMGARKHHHARREEQRALSNAIAWWAGLESAQGRGESESYRRFYFKFGLDAASARTLGTREAAELTQRVNAELQKYGIDGTVNAAAYFAHHQ